MNRLFSLAIIFLTFVVQSCGQTNSVTSCYELFTDTLSGQELYGYKYNGKVQIEAKYISTYSDSLCNMAIVLDREKGWLGVDKNNKTILIPYIYDNGPDYVEDGLFRFVENEKLGFANLEGEKIIPAQFDFVTPFSNGYAQYFIGGERIYENGKTQKQIIDESGYGGLIDLHWSWGGNITETGYVNKRGQRLKEKPEDAELEIKAKEFTQNLIQLIEQKDYEKTQQHITEKVYCYLCFSETPNDTPFVSKNTFVHKHIDRIFNKILLERLKRNELTFFTEKSDKEYSYNCIVLYTTYRNNEFGDGHEGAQFGFWLKTENGQFKLSGVETIP